MKNPKIFWAIASVVVIALIVLILSFALAKTPDTIGICYRDNTTEDNRAIRTALENYLEEAGYRVISVDADGDQAKQITLLNELKDRKCKGLLVEPVMSAAAEDLIHALENTGLPAVLFRRDIDLLQSDSPIAWVGTDPAQPGILLAQMMASLPEGGDLNGDGVVSYIILQGNENHIDAVSCVYALENALAEGPFVAERLSLQYGDWTLESGRKLCKQELAVYGKDIEVIFCGNMQITRGAVEAIADGGRTVGKDIYLFGIGEERDLVSQEIGIAYLNPEQLAKAAADRLLSMIGGNQAENITVIPYTALMEE